MRSVAGCGKRSRIAAISGATSAGSSDHGQRERYADLRRSKSDTDAGKVGVHCVEKLVQQIGGKLPVIALGWTPKDRLAHLGDRPRTGRCQHRAYLLNECCIDPAHRPSAPASSRRVEAAGLGREMPRVRWVLIRCLVAGPVTSQRVCQESGESMVMRPR